MPARLRTLLTILVLSMGFTATGATAEKMYWTVSSGAIRRANLDGSAVENLITKGLTDPGAIALDTVAGKMYFSDGFAILGSNLDATNVEELISSPVRGIALDLDERKVYWAWWLFAFLPPPFFGEVDRANLDGTSQERLIDSFGEAPSGVALDLPAGKLYWIDGIFRKISRANLDGTAIELVVQDTGGFSPGIALDLGTRKVYWTSTDSFTPPQLGTIQRANLDGTNVEELVSVGVESPVGIALDLVAGKMYWADEGTGKIQRANLDGTGVENLITEVSDGPLGIALDVPGPCCLPGGVCIVSMAVECSAQGGTPRFSTLCQGDVDGDGVDAICGDACPLDNPDDTDGDGVCDSDDACPLDNPDDTDGDGVCDTDDPCPLDNPDDTDGDAVCDSNDPCPVDNPDDDDGDGVCNSVDVCPDLNNTLDTDADGVPDCFDGCPTDANKTAPGQCGCGVADTDSDGDTVADCVDRCPSVDDRIDADNDGHPDCLGPDVIPAVSAWGLATLTLGLLAIGRAYFGRRRARWPQQP